jgi:hypothetical protein
MRSLSQIASVLAAGAMLILSTRIARSQSCRNATLNGSCVIEIVSAPTGAGVAAGMGPETLVGLATFDGAGKVAFQLHKNANGVFVDADAVGRYMVQPNCEGSYIHANITTGDDDTSDFVLSPSRHTLRLIYRSSSEHNPTLRVSSGICRFDE